MHVRKKLAGLFAALCLTLGLSAAVAPSASASVTVSGSLTCVSGAFLEGVWVDATSGSDGWASTTILSDGHSKSWTFTLTAGTTYKLDVGCGGSQQNWAVSLHTGTLSGNHNFMLCYDTPYEDPYYGTCR